MSKVLIVYWSGTGNTEKMAELIAEGARAASATVDVKPISQVTVADALAYDILAIGSPSMGAEVLEENEIEPFVEELGGQVKDRKIGIFGSYGWGDGEWMRNWAERMRGYGANLLDDGLMVHETPEGDAVQACKDFGGRLAAM